MKRKVYAAAAAAAVVLIGMPTLQAAEITLNPSTRHQTIEGWGADFSSTDINTLNAYRDLGMNILRMNNAKEVLVDPSGDYRLRVPLDGTLQQNIDKMNFNIPQVSGFGATAQWLKANVLEPDRFKLIADSWSPPNWMKGPTGASQSFVGNPSYDSPSFPTPWLSGQYNHWYNNGPAGNPHFVGYSGASIGGRLKTEDPTTLAEFGKYEAAWVVGFEQTYGVHVDNVSLANESAFENPFDSMVLTVDPYGKTDFNQYAMALQSARDAFAANGITTTIRGPHMNGVGNSPSNPYRTWIQIGMINGVKNNSDPTLIKALDSYTGNYYVGYDETSVRMLAAYWHGTNNVALPPGESWATWAPNPNGLVGDGKANWWVETGDGGGAWRSGLTSGANPAITVALKMQNALVYSDAAAYLYWQFTDGYGSPGEYGLLGADQVTNPTASKKYDAFKQFSRYIRPGAQRIDAVFADTGTAALGGASEYDTLHSVSVSAYVNDLDHTLTLVLLNMTGDSSPISFDLPEELKVLLLHAFRTSDTENFAQLADLPVVDGRVAFALPAYSVLTLTGDLVNAVPEPASLLILAAGAGGVLLRRRGRRLY